MATAATPADASILEPVANGPVGDCRPADVRFVRVQLNLDFRDLCTAAAATDNTTLRASYYIEVPQSMAVDAPVELVEAAFNLATVTTESQGIHARITNDILRIALAAIEHAIFEVLCPGYMMEPQAAAESVFQVTKDPEGNAITYTVAQYYAYLLASAQPLLNQRTLPVDLVGIFIKNSHPDIQNVLKETYPRMNDVRSREKRFVTSELNAVLKLMISAEHRITSTQDIINRAIGGQSFVSGSPAYASVAERTLAKDRPHDQVNDSVRCDSRTVKAYSNLKPKENPSRGPPDLKVSPSINLQDRQLSYPGVKVSKL
eukprot:scaffold51757_cov42-Cyclotella_meneghiniana.AAC.8